jgi:tetratricopeptide (TPR) repeat protein
MSRSDDSSPPADGAALPRSHFTISHRAASELLRLAKRVDLAASEGEAPSPQEVRSALDALQHGRGRRTPPRPAEIPALIQACLRLARWAEATDVDTAEGCVKTAMRLDPGDNEPVFELALLARSRGDVATAEEWFRESIRLAEQRGAWKAMALAWLALGRLYRQNGSREDEAVSAYVRALRTAREYGVSEAEAYALHNLCVMALIRKDLEAGLSYARKALDAYGRDPQGIRILAQDLAWYWMDTEGAYERALPIFRAVLPSTGGDERRQLQVTANLARAAAGAHEQDEYGSARRSVWQQLQRNPQNEQAAPALLELARGAFSIGQSREATEAAREALRHARARNEVQTASEIEALLEQIAAGANDAFERQATSSAAVVAGAEQLAMRLLLLLRTDAFVTSSGALDAR